MLYVCNMRKNQRLTMPTIWPASCAYPPNLPSSNMCSQQHNATPKAQKAAAHHAYYLASQLRISPQLAQQRHAGQRLIRFEEANVHGIPLEVVRHYCHCLPLSANTSSINLQAGT
jgi:hypothetical protein